jgi:hypothetical protein
MSRSTDSPAQDVDATQDRPDTTRHREATEADHITFAATRMPEIVATFISRWSIADTAEHGDPMRQRQLLIEALEHINAFLGALAVLEYVRYENRSGRPGQGAEADSEVFVVNSGSRTLTASAVQAAEADSSLAFLRGGDLVTWGSWTHLRRDCVNAFATDPRRMFCPELAELNSQLRGAGGPELLDVARNLRNARAHGITRSRTQEEADATTCRELLFGLLAQLQKFLGELRLVRVLRLIPGPDNASENPAAWDLVVEDRTGSGSPCAVYRLHGVTVQGRPPGQGELALLRPKEGASWHALGLFPLYVWVPDVDGGEIALYEGKPRGKVRYLGLRTGDRHEIDLDDRFDDALSRWPGAAEEAVRDALIQMEDTWKRALSNARTRSSTVLDQVRKEKVYFPAAFVERSRARERLVQFLDAAVRNHTGSPVTQQRLPPRLLLVTGMAGSGKTSFLCRLTELLGVRWPLVPVMLVRAAEVEGAGRKAVELCLQWLGLDRKEQLRELLIRVDQLTRTGQSESGEETKSCLDNPLTGGIVVLLIDGIDRAGDPRHVLRELDTAISDLPGLICIATIARPVLEGAADLMKDLENLARFGDTSTDDLAVSVGALDDSDARNAWERYRQQLGSSPVTVWEKVNPSLQAAARNPLLLRLACEAYNGCEVPTWATEVDVLEEHARRHIWSDFRRAHFVRMLVRSLWQKGTQPLRRLELATILSNEHLREGALDPTGPLEALEQAHVLVRVPISGRGLYDAPDYAVEFAFDALLGYLFFALVEKETEDRARPAQRVMEFARHASTASPLGYAVDLVLRSEFAREAAGTSAESSWLECVKSLLKPDSSGVPPPTQTSAVARFLAWVHTQGPPDAQAFATAMGQAAEVRDDCYQAATNLLERLHRDGRASMISQGPCPEVPEWPVPLLKLNSIEVAKRIASVVDCHAALRAVAEHLEERSQPMLAGFLAHLLLGEMTGRPAETRDTLAARRLCAQALLQAGSVGALQAALRGLSEAPEKALELREENEYRKLQRLLARIHRAQGDVTTALSVVANLLDQGVYTRDWKREEHVQNVLLRAELLLDKDPRDAQVFLGLSRDSYTPPEKWAKWANNIQADLNEICQPGTFLAAWRTEIEASLVNPDEAFESFVRAMLDFQSVGATAAAANVLARLTRFSYRKQTDDGYTRAMDFGQRARALADVAGTTEAWFLAAEWEARARDRYDPTAPEAFRLAREALERALRLGHRHFLAQSLVAVSATSSGSSRHLVAAEAREIAVRIYRELVAEKCETEGKLASTLADLCDCLLDVGRVQEAVDVGREAWKLARDNRANVPWSAVSIVRALAIAALNDRSQRAEFVAEANGVLEALAEHKQEFERMLTMARYRWQYARAEALTLVAAGDPNRALERLNDHAEAFDPKRASKQVNHNAEALANSRDDSESRAQAAIGSGVINAWYALLIAMTNPDHARVRAGKARTLLDKVGANHLPVASYALALALRTKANREQNSRHSRNVDRYLATAREEIEDDYPEIYKCAEPETALRPRQVLEEGNTMVQMIMFDRGFPPE